MGVGLTEAIEALHRAFADVPKPRSIDACPCCFSDAEVEQLLALDRGVLAEDLLGNYASSALTTIGSVADYMFFLPSILELEATRPTWPIDVEITGGKFKLADAPNWPDHHRLAVQNFYLAWLESVATDDVDGFVFDSIMCAVGRTGFDMPVYLAAAEAWPEAIGEWHEINAHHLLKKNKLSNAFWDEGESHDAVVEWFASPAIKTVTDEYYSTKYT